MVDMKRLVPVRNRNNGSTGYTLKEEGIFRIWHSQDEVKQIPMEELIKANYIPGIEYIFKNLLIIEDEEALQALNMRIEPEYKYTREDIKELLTSVDKDSLDRLEDFLNFAPDGGIDVLRHLAVELEIPDTRKRKLISEKTGFSIDNAIYINQMMQNPEDEEEEEKVERKVKTVEKTTQAGRKTTPKYNVTSISE